LNINIKDNTITGFDKNLKRKQHLPLSTRFDQIEVLDNDCILVCEYYYKFDLNGKSNIYCLNRFLDIVWFLPLPNADLQSDDIYVGFNSNGNQVCANSWSGFWVEIDTNTGDLKEVKFTK
jgi:hypothetical protein